MKLVPSQKSERKLQVTSSKKAINESTNSPQIHEKKQPSTKQE